MNSTSRERWLYLIGMLVGVGFVIAIYENAIWLSALSFVTQIITFVAFN